MEDGIRRSLAEHLGFSYELTIDSRNLLVSILATYKISKLASICIVTINSLQYNPPQYRFTQYVLFELGGYWMMTTLNFRQM